ncbi:hypothetical protein F7725_017748 [Dissostichus mawsoni]|uniref:Uncharacterized protein n=1 Tax=Dissostichus mawsoni TaxID=36200 RepID=A0A7J5XQ12_DISMA|nr:hypothetical protein F7725_017748 [Dissostichus mawsoni]
MTQQQSQRQDDGSDDKRAHSETLSPHQRSPWGASRSLTCDGDGEQTALRGEVLRNSRDVINTAVASLVGGLCSREQEVGRVIDSWL